MTVWPVSVNQGSRGSPGLLLATRSMVLTWGTGPGHRELSAVVPARTRERAGEARCEVAPGRAIGFADRMVRPVGRDLSYTRTLKSVKPQVKPKACEREWSGPTSFPVNLRWPGLLSYIAPIQHLDD